MLSSVPSNYCRGILSRMGECLGLFFSALNFLEVYRNQSQGNGLGTPAGATTCWAWPGSEFSDLGIYRVGIFRPKIQKKSFYELERCRNAQNEKITCTEGYMLASFGDWWVERRQIGSEKSDLGRSENSDLIFLAQSIPKRSKRKKNLSQGVYVAWFWRLVDSKLPLGSENSDLPDPEVWKFRPKGSSKVLFSLMKQTTNVTEKGADDKFLSSKCAGNWNNWLHKRHCRTLSMYALLFVILFYKQQTTIS